eukprot:gnl/TRDRNA2_/TRDRNA2_191249_c0_seq1.p1 gnl/TRDRNA2_/TRDRNA2_191249_c0~~gnl/TRDRNA2_/TRDRNA2_191249_c0_seq1.p1  ORF type:complete len:269 (+),score=52.96 gnl/TRDRNA2_/TRDRNA2_191249_c0_seq1:107-913(+)
MESPADDVVLFQEDNDGIATITLNRPKAMNSLSEEVFERLLAITRRLRRRDATAKVVILTASGDKAFSAGNDVRGGAFTAKGDPRLQIDTIEALDRLPQPLLACVNGVCFTGALELLMAADFVLAGKDRAIFCDTHAKLGLVPTWGLSVRLPRKVGLSNAKLISFSGRRFSAVEAANLGLVDMVIDDALLQDAAKGLALEIAANSTDSIRKQKRMMDTAYMANGREALDWLDPVYGFHPGVGKDMSERMKTHFGAGRGKASQSEKSKL